MIIPNMGMGKAVSLSDALFTPVQQRVLALLFGQPDRRFQSAELIRLADSGTGAVHRQLRRLEESGLVEVTRTGNQKHYQARRDSPIFDELHGLVVKTIAVVEPLRAALEPLEDQVLAAFVFGSFAKGTERSASDIDLLVVSDDLTYPDVYGALQSAEEVLGRPVNPTVLTREEWRRKSREPDSFAARISGQPKLFLIGSDDDLR